MGRKLTGYQAHGTPQRAELPLFEQSKKEAIKRKTRQRIKGVGKKVRWLLEHDERCRNSDKWLGLKVFQWIIDGEKSMLENFEATSIRFGVSNFTKLPAFDSIKRARAKIQNTEGQFRPTEDTEKVREATEEAYREWGQTNF